MAAAYEQEILNWRAMVEERLRAEDSWLTLTGLYWLHEGANSVGSDPASDVWLPESAPQRLGVLDFHDKLARFQGDVPVMIDGTPAQTAALRDDHDPAGATRVEVGSVSFTVIKRGEKYGVRVRDRDNPSRTTFSGRIWYPVAPSYKVTATFVPHPVPRTIGIETMAGVVTPMENPGWAKLELNGAALHLEAFSAHEDEVWFVFRDETSKAETYPAGRFLYAPLHEDGTVLLDFNKAYNPPCAFTPYATCPLPPKENHLPIRIEAGELLPETHY